MHASQEITIAYVAKLTAHIRFHYNWCYVRVAAVNHGVDYIFWSFGIT